MNKKHSAALRSFRRVREFLTAHTPPDAPPSFVKKSAELDDVMAAMSQEANEQDTGTRLGAGETQRQRALRATLWNDHMLPIAEVSRGIYGVPGVKEALRLPRKSADNDRLLAAADGMANAADADKAVFLEHGMQPDFVDQLRASMKALREALVARVETGRRRRRATKAMEQQVLRGTRAVQVLNGILKPMLRRNPDLEAAWESARARTEPSGGPSPAEPASTAQVPAPTTQATSVAREAA